MSEKREFRPVLACAMTSLSSFSAWNFSSLVMSFIFFGGAAAAVGAASTAAAAEPSAVGLALMLMSNFFTFVGSRKSCAPTPIASLDCRPRLPIAAFDTVSAASASTNSS